jgi:hypothetical protein
VSAHDSDWQNGAAELLLAKFFRDERPTTWPEPPWRRQSTSPRGSDGLRGRSILVAALVLAAVGLSMLGELPSTWPGPQDTFSRGKMEASRLPAPTKKTRLPGFRVPADPNSPKPDGR